MREDETTVHKLEPGPIQRPLDEGRLDALRRLVSAHERLRDAVDDGRVRAREQVRTAGNLLDLHSAWHCAQRGRNEDEQEARDSDESDGAGERGSTHQRA